MLMNSQLYISYTWLNKKKKTMYFSYFKTPLSHVFGMQYLVLFLPDDVVQNSRLDENICGTRGM